LARRKLAHFAENAEASNLIERGKPQFGHLSGKWGKEQFGNDHPIVLEIGCGRGEYTVGLAARSPEQNFIGIDIKGGRLWKGSQVAIEQGLSNVAFLRTYVQQIREHFGEGEISEIWITFPDPRPKNRDIKRRLTSTVFLELYRQLLKPGGVVHLKTDDAGLYGFSKWLLGKLGIPLLADTSDLYHSGHYPLAAGIQTTFEAKYLTLGQPIHYLSFSFPEGMEKIPRMRELPPAEFRYEPVTKFG
jgi:tRNA (guanine-N7-)-methyltransferase